MKPAHVLQIPGFTALLASLLLLGCTDTTTTYKATYRNLTEAVYSTATIVPLHEYTVYAPVSGIISDLAIAEGDTIRTGATIALISDDQAQVLTDNAQLRYDNIKDSYTGSASVLDELQESIATAQIQRKQDSLNYRRQERLWQQDIGSLQSFEAAKLTYEVSSNAVQRLTSNYQRQKADLARQVKQAANTLRGSKISQEDYIVKSKIDGIAYEVLKEAGELASSQSPIAVIGSYHDYLIKLLIDEVDIVSVYPGQAIAITLDAYGTTVYRARVTKIYPTKDQRTQTFTVEGIFDQEPPRLFRGLSGEANIIISQKEQVLAIPTQLIDATGHVRTTDGLVAVETGVSNVQYTEVISGIDSSTTLLEIE